MRRYLLLYLYFIRFSLSRAMEFRLDFYFRIVMDIVFYLVNIGFFTILYGHTSLVGGWTLDDIYVFVCSFLLLDAVHMTIFSNNVWWLPIFINRGDLDYYLVRPVSSLYMLSLRDFAANSSINLVIAGGLMWWAIARHPVEFGAARLLCFFGFLVIGSFVHYLVRMLFVIPVFWLQSPRGLDEVLHSIDRLGERPDQIYRPWLRRIVTTILPLAFVASIPSHVLLSGLTLGGLLHAAAVTGGFFLVVLWTWRRGLRAYSSASS